MRDNFRLVAPSPAWLPAFLDLAREFHAHAEPRYEDALRDPEAFLRRRAQYAAGKNLPPDRVPETTFWLVAGEGEPGGVERPQVLAVTGLRHQLTPRLTDIGGHIGYAVRPSARRRGVGAALLALTLVEARKQGLMRVLVTCDVTNIGSARIIQRSGGVLEDKRTVRGTPSRLGATGSHWSNPGATLPPGSPAAPAPRVGAAKSVPIALPLAGQRISWNAVSQLAPRSQARLDSRAK